MIDGVMPPFLTAPRLHNHFSTVPGVLVCQLLQTHTELVALLLYLVAVENCLDSDLRVAADFTGPVKIRYNNLRKKKKT